ncbi:MAG: Dam family site-specific DNA-(adenine-N6)-methyltransferase [Gammaproteobacteria bacterium]|nr:Dam family site-specific DNA-(adenine-N6)-methyltransferase [Gammaproteobacteria bacterium]NIR83340.1 Dam family site-specific DNA-(adenine-N6)-methyltransferase [Gammaproteobacteria bacterium]NIR91140.1 Dam family site-specific DNA-(adenine-N6)-methyltransferase [Gammaproteobacteria bacterium]NIU04507.1 Dam family site-specific DNA-(adenine-N6)-methyltransferase [Gammaproteobacteria bacterium]NIW87143.1 Dam family site-specific DNA-(adenine-N6)-methyltransferase [Gammaproteobacteria bacteri
MARAQVSSTATFGVEERPLLKPPLKWAGGKRWLIPHMHRLWLLSACGRLVEPFCGGLAVALGLGPRRALLNDVNEHPVNFYRWLQRGLRIRILMRNDPELFYQHRAEFNRLITTRGRHTRKAAELFYYLNRTAYNGLCRFNRRGEFNVPFGRYKTIRYVHDFTPYRRALTGWEFTEGDFAEMALHPDDFVYADPPYDVQFRQYSKGGFDWFEQERLAVWLSHHRGPVALSNQATPRIIGLYRKLGFELHHLDAPRAISCNGDRAPAREVLALRNVSFE